MPAPNARRSPRAVLVAAAAAALAACGAGAAAPDAGPIDAAPTAGAFALRWTLVAPDAAALACADVDGASVRVVATPIDGLEGFVESFACDGGEATSAAHPPGRFRLTIDLRARAGGSLLDAPVEIPSVEIVAGEVGDAGTAAFVVEAVGRAGFRIDMPAAASNCGGLDEGGAGLVGVGFALERDGACVDGAELTIEEGAGGGTAGTYTTSCATPARFGCVENDQAIGLAELASGGYALIATGYLAGEGGGEPIACFTRTAAIAIPGNHLAAALGTLLLVRAGAPACQPVAP